MSAEVCQLNDLILVGRKVGKLSMNWVLFSTVFERPAISIDLIEKVKRKKYDVERERFLNKMWKKNHSYTSFLTISITFYQLCTNLILLCLILALFTRRGGV